MSIGDGGGAGLGGGFLGGEFGGTAPSASMKFVVPDPVIFLSVYPYSGSHFGRSTFVGSRVDEELARTNYYYAGAFFGGQTFIGGGTTLKPPSLPLVLGTPGAIAYDPTGDVFQAGSFRKVVAISAKDRLKAGSFRAVIATSRRTSVKVGALWTSVALGSSNRLKVGSLWTTVAVRTVAPRSIGPTAIIASTSVVHTPTFILDDLIRPAVIAGTQLFSPAVGTRLAIQESAIIIATTVGASSILVSIEVDLIDANAAATFDGHHHAAGKRDLNSKSRPVQTLRY